jgi:glycosyltransferase involved in cell wall biosynthesis
MTETLISICIPVYKNAEFVKRLLDSVKTQTFRDFEVVVSDDSPGGEGGIKEICDGYTRDFTLHYHRNDPAAGTPENWNKALHKATGRWIKLMHDDDWFSDPGSLEQFTRAIKMNPGVSFIFSAYQNVFLDEKKQEAVLLGTSGFRMLCRDPAILISSNMIGPPSVVMHLREEAFSYDRQLHWLVDIDFYMQCLQGKKPVYIDELLVNIGVNSQQVTRQAFGNPAVEIPEYFYLLQKRGEGVLQNIRVYDAFWRLLRNLGVRSEEQVFRAGYQGKIPAAVGDMIHFQDKIPPALLRVKICSKIFMSLSFLIAKVKGKTSRHPGPG